MSKAEERVMVQPTAEQLFALEKFKTQKQLKISAFAGTGKTTTLNLLANSRSTKGLYLAFNKATEQEASAKFPKNVNCKTTHALAWRSIAPQYAAQKMKGKLVARQLAEELSLKDVVFGEYVRLNGVHQAHLMIQTIRRFCQSADDSLRLGHIPIYGRLLGASPETASAVREWALNQCGALWTRMTAPRDVVPLSHDGYLKLWALGRPKIGAEFILLDEAQDTNEVVLAVLADQEAQIVYVGDRHQQIYEWRGAINAMAKVTDCEEAYLTHTFRFGAAIASEATRVLQTLGEKLALQGNPAIKSEIIAVGDADAVLARTNATVILEVLDAIACDKTPCVAGGTAELERLLGDVFELKKGNPGTCPEFFGFNEWQDVVAFADTDEGEDLRTFVQLVEQHGERKLWRAVKSAIHDEDKADIILSTAHKAKGREWDAVRLAPDFLNSRLVKGHPDAPSEVRLFYVAMTRARKRLVADPEMLATFTTGGWRTREAA